VSSKGRKGHQVEDDEFYPTPRDAIVSLMETDLISLPGGVWIEPCAGSGRIVSTVNECRQDQGLEHIDWIMCELNPDFDPYLRRLVRGKRDTLMPYGDFVHRDWPYPMADVLIMNPPFSLTFQFVMAALERARIVLCVQRQGWFGTQERSPWLTRHCPDSFQLPWRPSFRPDGKTDSCEYCWFHWPEGSVRGRRQGRLAMLDFPRKGQQSLFG
jgi:hypothetical protein